MKEFRKNIPVGSLITTYYSGYHILSRITGRPDQGDLYHFVKVADKMGTPSTIKTERCCDEYFCEIADPQKIYDDETRATQYKFDCLRKYSVHLSGCRL